MYKVTQENYQRNENQNCCLLGSRNIRKFLLPICFYKICVYDENCNLMNHILTIYKVEILKG